jgi:hypothetical protein
MHRMPDMLANVNEACASLEGPSTLNSWRIWWRVRGARMG